MNGNDPLVPLTALILKQGQYFDERLSVLNDRLAALHKGVKLLNEKQEEIETRLGAIEYLLTSRLRD